MNQLQRGDTEVTEVHGVSQSDKAATQKDHRIRKPKQIQKSKFKKQKPDAVMDSDKSQLVTDTAKGGHLDI